MIINFECVCIEEHMSLVAALERGEFQLKPKKQELYMKNRESSPSKLSINEAPK